MKILHTLLAMACLLAGLTACTDESTVPGSGGTTLPNGDVVLKVNAYIPTPPQIVTRDIDPDGLGVTTLWLFCFDEFGAYIGRTEVPTSNIQPPKDGKYGFTATVPGPTRIIHFFSNLYIDDVSASPGMNETTLIPSLVSASGRMVYWGRKAFATAAELDAFSKGGDVELFRNQAKVYWKITGTAATEGLDVFGYALCNRMAWGTVAPFNPASKENPFEFNLDNPYVTEPDEEHRVIASDPLQVNEKGDEAQGDPHYIFENPNTLDAPVYAIMRIGKTEGDAKYYKIMFVDGKKDQLHIFRNYEYQINISSLPDQMGYDSFEDAKSGLAANNAWVSVDPEIPELSDGTNSLSIANGTTQIFNAGGEQTIDFTYDGGIENISVSWLENDGSLSATAPVLVDNGSGNYQIKMQLAQPGEKPVIGTLLLRAGVFTRRIKLYLMKPFEFKPVWVSTGVPMAKGERLSMTFVIPDTYPEELFPITCKIATNNLNANDNLGVQLPVISEECRFEFVNEAGGPTVVRTTNWGYKFVYTATRPGIQSVFFKLNTSSGSDPEGSVSGCNEQSEHAHVFLQADNFRDEEKLVLFQSRGNRNITIKGAATDNEQYHSVELYPTVNRKVPITLNFSSTLPANAVIRMATTTLKPDPEFNATEGPYYVHEKTSNGIVDYYWIKPGAVNSLTLNFVTATPDVDDLVRFSIDNENEFGYNSDASSWYKSAAVELISKPRFTFTFKILDDDQNQMINVKYGKGQKAKMYFRIDKEAVATTRVKLFIGTKNLEPDPDDEYSKWLTPAEGGYFLDIPQGFQLQDYGTLSFVTKRIASGETVTVRTADETQALFTTESVTFSNQPITGTIKLDSDPSRLTTNSFITLERKNGTRVGVLNIASVDNNNVATYKLSLRPEYDFTMDEPLTISYNYYGTAAGGGSVHAVYQKQTVFTELIKHEVGQQVPLITLIQQ